MNSKVNKKSQSIEQIIDLIQQFDQTIEYPGTGNQSFNLKQKVSHLKPLSEANQKDLSFCTDPKMIDDLDQSKAALVLISEKIQSQYQSKFNRTIKPNWLVCKQPRLSFDQLCLHFYPPKAPSIHPSAMIDRSAKIGKNAAIGAGVVIGEGVEIGDDALIYANATIYDQVKIGDQVIIHSGSVIGSDGFGFELIENKAHKQPQIGSVIIGNRVEIGANCAIDRGSVGDTIIADEVKIDNLVHIAHNVKIGSQTAIMGSSGIAGGAVIGKQCQIFGMVAINGHISIADGVKVMGHSTVTKSIAEKNTNWASTSRQQPAREWSKNAILATKLIDLFKSVKAIENKIGINKD